jgi:hypothetical protein
VESLLQPGWSTVYAPYLYGRQAELSALKDIASVIGGNDQIVFPLIEPVKSNTTLRRTLETLAESNATSYVVINSRLGDFTGNQPALQAWLDDASDVLADTALVRPTFREHSGVTVTDIEAFLDDYPDRPVGLLLTSERIDADALEEALDGRECVAFFESTSDARSFEPHLTATADIVQRFTVRRPNIQYDGVPDEPFGRAHRTWKRQGRAGFSDYTVLETTFREAGGGGAAAVVAHLTYETGTDLMVQHFMSDDREQGDDGGKIVQVADAVVRQISATPGRFEDTVGLRSFIDRASTRTSTNLATLKRWQIAHHIETVHLTMVR